MPVPLIAVASVAGKVGGLLGIDFGGGSPRYAGGPLISTVRSGVTAIAGGDLGTIRVWDNARKTASDKAAWQQVWQNELPAIPLTSAQAALVRSLDPTLGITGAGGSSTLPQAPSSPSAAPAGGPSLLAGGMGTILLVALVIFAAVYFFRRS
jgi:hypothetical protein